jgi:hypothetical protein
MAFTRSRDQTNLKHIPMEAKEPLNEA